MLDDFLGWLFGLILRLFYFLFSTIVSLLVNAISAARMRRRSHPYRRFAQQRGLRYDPELPGALAGRGDAPFNHVGSATGFGALTGQLGRWPFLTCEYRYVLEGANFEFERYRRVALIRLPTTLPPMQVGPEGRFSQLFPGLAPLDVDIENHHFNRAYRVSVARESAARRFAVAVLNPRAVEALMALEPFGWRIAGDELIGWWPVGGPDEAMLHVQTLVALAEGIPPFVWSDVGGRTDWTQPVVAPEGAPPPQRQPQQDRTQPAPPPPPEFKDVLRARRSGPPGPPPTG